MEKKGLTPIEKGGSNENNRVAPPKSYSELQAYLIQDFLNMEFAFKYGMWVPLRHSKFQKP